VFRVHAGVVDYAILAIYFVVVLGIGLAARRQVHTGLDFFLSGRSLPAWITGLAFIAANLGALEILGLAANGAKYGAATVHFYWIGAIPAMVFLGIAAACLVPRRPAGADADSWRPRHDWQPRPLPDQGPPAHAAGL
jgi:Na+/proline symporter